LIGFGLACLLTGLSKGGLGGTLGGLITPLLALFLPANVVVGLMLPVLMLGDLFAISMYWRKWDRHHSLLLLFGSLFGVAGGTFFLNRLSPEALRHGLGLIVLVFSLYRWLEPRLVGRLKVQPQPWHGMLAGGVAGFTSTLAHAGGPPVTIYLLTQQLAPTAFVATSALFFTVLNWIKVPSYFLSGMFQWELQLRLAWLLPLVPLGAWLGQRLVQRINRRWFDRIVSFFLLLSGLLLLR